MREIKFRAWIKTTEEMDEFIYDLNFKEDEKQKEIHLYRDEILMQYTGLKDKNGVEIYEGDIVLHYVHLVPNPIQKVIEFWEGSFIAIPYYEGSQSHQSMVNFAPIRTMEVIGNIYENPELLESK